MPSPPRVRFVPDSEESEDNIHPSMTPNEDLADYDYPNEDVGPLAENALPPANPTFLQQPVDDDDNIPHGYVAHPQALYALHTSLATLPRDALSTGASVFRLADQAATSPHAKKIVVHGLPWPLHVAPTGDFSHVTVRNIIDSLRMFLKGGASSDDFASATNPEAVSRAFYRRTRHNQPLRDAGVIRADFLHGPIVGLEPIAGESAAVFTLVFGV